MEVGDVDLLLAASSEYLSNEPLHLLLIEGTNCTIIQSTVSAP